MTTTYLWELSAFLSGKSSHTFDLFNHFIRELEKTGPVSLRPAKTMIGISNGQKHVAWVTQLCKEFIHTVLSFNKTHENNLCFQKIAEVPGGAKKFNHHFRMPHKEAMNKEVICFLKLVMLEKVDAVGEKEVKV